MTTRLTLCVLALAALLPGCDLKEALIGINPDLGVPMDALGVLTDAVDVPTDATGCQAPNVLRYEQPGCGQAAPAPKCGGEGQDLCATLVCSCAGKVIGGCDYYGAPWSRRLSFPAFNVGNPCDPAPPRDLD